LNNEHKKGKNPVWKEFFTKIKNKVKNSFVFNVKCNENIDFCPNLIVEIRNKGEEKTFFGKKVSNKLIGSVSIPAKKIELTPEEYKKDTSDIRAKFYDIKGNG